MTRSATIRFFSYGALQLDNVQLSSFGRLLDGQEDTMPGWRKDWLEITDPDVLATSGQRYHPAVSPSPNRQDAVERKVFLITADELEAADRYEVDSYRRIEATLGSGMRAWVYVAA